ncbi:MAG: TlpA disulfide reductase family protein [Peptoniphilus sp.]|nr:TlpA disulfide reductase family protein [Peptoniphilus sp.]MDY3118291.1 TlpA disulfide reductase family protein [Peptoniphilus sp.]
MNKRMKKILLIGFIASMSLGLMACGKKESQGENSPKNVVQEESVETSKNGASNGEKETSNKDTIAPFTTEDIEGKAFTEADLSKNKLTMVNVFATWCTACIQEIPDLEKLNAEMKDKGVGVVGVCMDTYEDGKDVVEAVDKAKAIKDKLKITYPILKPSDNFMNDRLQGIQALPETFFVDSKGNIVGESYSGAKSLEEWKTVVEKELKNVQ